VCWWGRRHRSGRRPRWGLTDQDIYRVGVAADSPYHDVVDRHTALTPSQPDRDRLAAGEIDLLVVPDSSERTSTSRENGDSEVNLDVASQSTVSVVHASTQKGTAALTTFRSAIQRYNDRTMALEDNETAAYPVSVELQYRSRQ